MTARFPCDITHSALDAPGRLAEQLWLGVFHLGCVEDLLTLYLVQVQEATETHGGCVGEDGEANTVMSKTF